MIFNVSGGGSVLPKGGAAGQVLTKTETGTAWVKAPGQPYNLLDNSDFTNPVNQRGITSTTASGYCIDRWVFARSGTTGEFAVSDSGITITKTDSEEYCDFKQRIADADMITGKKVTLATKFAGHNPICCSFTYPDNSVNANINDNIRLFCYSNYVYIRLRSDSTELTAEWVALYEGEYTTETLPEYHPKGYGAELAECMRYFQVIKQYTVLLGSNMSTSAYVFSLPLSVPMRIAPTISLPTGAYINVGGITGWTPSNATSYANNPIIRLVTTLENHGLSGYAYLQVSGGDMRLNADL